MSVIPFHQGVKNLQSPNEIQGTSINHDDISDLFTESELALLSHVPALQKDKIIPNSAKLLKTLKEINKDTTWIETFKELLLSSNDTPMKVAESLGIAWCTVLGLNKSLKEKGDASLDDLLKLSKAAFAERIMFHPEQYAGNSQMAVFLAKSQAGWRDQEDTNEFGTPTSQELENILQARQSMADELKLLESAYHKGSHRNDQLAIKTA